MITLVQINRSLPIIIFLFLFFLNNGRATTFFDLKTGGQNSASWKYAEDLSTLWNIRFQDEPIRFTPNPSDQWEDRLHSLRSGHSRFMIAPLQDESSDFFLDNRVQIVSTLWRVFLVPISTKKQTLEILEESQQIWLVPENSVIIPSFISSKKQLHSKDESPPLQPQEDPIQIDQYRNIKRDEFIQYLKVAAKENEEKDESIKEEEKVEKEESIKEDEKEATSKGELDESVFFVEMVGPTEKLMKKINPELFVYGLQKKFQQKLITALPWLSDTYFTYKNKKRRNTVRYTMALYTLKDEESEFIEKLAELIASPPITSFPHPYLVRHRNTSMTKEIPPQLLHEGTRNYYKIEYTPPVEEPMEEPSEKPKKFGAF